MALGSSIELVALKALIVICILLLQKPSRVSKVRDHISCLERHLALWKDGNLIESVLEGRVLQQCLPSYSHSDHGVTVHREFSKYMYDANVKSSLHLLSRGGVLHFNAITSGSTEYVMRDTLKSKHLTAQPVDPTCLISDYDQVPTAHPMIFDTLNASVIRSAALHTNGAAGLSGINAYGCWRLCTSFRNASDGLCTATALFTKHLCTSYIDPRIVSPLMVCDLIA